jgi:leucyl aminopeptidase
LRAVPHVDAVADVDAAYAELKALGDGEGDPVWPMPLWTPYDEDLSSRVADLASVASTAFAGAIFGALFLRRFVTVSPAWLHLDLYGWNPKDRPGARSAPKRSACAVPPDPPPLRLGADVTLHRSGACNTMRAC